MFKPKNLIWEAALILLLLLSGIYLFQILQILLLNPRISVWRQLELYKWVGAGILLYGILKQFIRKNVDWMETFSHELTHIVVALLFGRKVTSFHAEEKTGVVYTTDSKSYDHLPISMAPYCLPIFTYLLLSVRCLLDFHGLWVYDILIGITLCFHFFCIKHQIGNYQTDINRYPLFLSYLYIVTAIVINVSIILVAFFPSSEYGVFSSLWRYITTLYQILTSLF